MSIYIEPTRIEKEIDITVVILGTQNKLVQQTNSSKIERNNPAELTRRITKHIAVSRAKGRLSYVQKQVYE